MFRVVLLGATAVLAALAMPAGAQAPGRPAGGLTDSQLLSRRMMASDGGHFCRFQHLPELYMAFASSGTLAFSEFIVTPKGHERSLLNELRLTFRPGAQLSGRVTVQKPAFRTQRIRSATLWVDGREVATGLQTRQQRRSSGGGYYENIGVPLLAAHTSALEGGRTAEVAVYDEATGAEAGRWSYDVSRLRYVGRALDLSKGTCS